MGSDCASPTLTAHLSRKLESLLRRLNVQSWIGPDAVMKVVTLGHVKDWKSWFLG